MSMFEVEWSDNLVDGDEATVIVLAWADEVQGTPERDISFGGLGQMTDPEINVLSQWYVLTKQ